MLLLPSITSSATTPLLSAKKVISPKIAPTKGRSAPSVRSVSLPNSQSTRTRPLLSRDMTLISAPTAPVQKQRVPIAPTSLKSFAFASTIQPMIARTNIGIIPSSIPPT